MFRGLSVFIRRKFRAIFKKTLSKKDIALVENKNFVIVSDNCWGGSLYQWYNRPYNSPFVGLFIHGDCYIKLLSNFDYLMILNKYSGRTLNDVNQYYIFPWVIQDYLSDKIDLTDPQVFRDLSKPMGAINPEKLKRFK